MQIQRIQNNSYHTQFQGTLTLFDNHYINPERIKQTIKITDDKTLHNAIEKILDEHQRSHSLVGGNSSAKKSDFTEYVSIINKLLNISPSMIEIQPRKYFDIVDFYYLYSNNPDGKSSYKISLNDRYSIKHEFNRNDIKTDKANAAKTQET